MSAAMGTAVPPPRMAWADLSASEAATLSYREVESDWHHYWAGELPGPPLFWCPWRDAARAVAFGAFYGRLVEGEHQAWLLGQARVA